MKMVLVSRLIVLLVVLVLHRARSTEDDITTIMEADDLLINENDPLEIKCTGLERISFIYPQDLGNAIVTSPVHAEEHIEHGIYIYMFQRRETVHGDTGLYGCPGNVLQVTSHPNFKTSKSMVYVYVQSTANVFVETNTFASLHAAVGGSAVIPCRPTSPNFTVQVFSNEMPVEQPNFNPRIGLTLTNITLKDSGYFKCVIDQADVDHEITYFFLVQLKPELLAPVIIEDTLRHVTRGQTLHVNCTTTVAADLTYGLIWNTPQVVRKQFIYLYPNYTGRFVTRIQLEEMWFYVKRYVENIKQNFFILRFSEN